MRPSVTLLVASRYFRTRRRETGNASTILSVVGTAVGVMALTVVLAVMNGFQLGFIEPIVEISSYHLQVSPDRGAAGGSQSLGRAVVSHPHQEPSRCDGAGAVSWRGRRSWRARTRKPRACELRAVPPDLFALDPVQAAMLAPREGSFDLTRPGSLVIGVELAAATGVRVGDSLALTSFAIGPSGRPAPRRAAFRVTGVFRTGYWDFDIGLVFTSLETADDVFGSGAPLPAHLRREDSEQVP